MLTFDPINEQRIAHESDNREKKEVENHSEGIIFEVPGETQF